MSSYFLPDRVLVLREISVDQWALLDSRRALNNMGSFLVLIKLSFYLEKLILTKGFIKHFTFQLDNF